MKKNVFAVGMLAVLMMSLTACGGEKQTAGTQTEATAAGAETTAEERGKTPETGRTEGEKAKNVTIAAAASLENCFTGELIPMFQEKYPEITIEGTYDSSGKLKTQIEEGAPVDLFFSAATKQMDDLLSEGLIAEDSVTQLLENKIVFIVPTGEENGYTAFEDIAKAENAALGDPESVPVGQYAKEALTNLGLWDEVSAKTSFGTNVTEVLNWVAEGSAKSGIVYSTDAAQKTDKVTVVAEAPKGSVKKAIYPIGIVKDCENPEGAALLAEFLRSEEAMNVFKNNGFAAVE